MDIVLQDTVFDLQSRDPYSILRKAVKFLESNQVFQFQDCLAQLKELRLSPEMSLQAELFIGALERHLDFNSNLVGNLYLKRFETSQIDVFDLLARFELVGLVSQFANQVLEGHILRSGLQHVDIIDVGIGSGRQMVDLLNKLSASDAPPASVIIKGIEPSQESLSTAEKSILALRSKCPFKIEFIPLLGVIESFSQSQLEGLRSSTGSLLINAAFSIHHVNSSSKQEVLQKLKSLNPRLLVMCEPDSNHESSSLSDRFENAWHHYGLAFQAIDALEASSQIKDQMKFFFFGREIADVLSKDNEKRTERHETGAMWAERLKEAGFKLSSGKEAAKVPSSDFFQIKQMENFDSFQFKGQSLVSILQAH